MSTDSPQILGVIPARWGSTRFPGKPLYHIADKPLVQLACLDLEGVLIPEIWISVAQKTGIDELLVTTREIPDYDELMTRRLGIL